MQKYLIDTQILIWSLISPEKLSVNIKSIFSENIICGSKVSLFEIAIKQKIGKLPELQISIHELEKRIIADGFELLPLSTKYIDKYSEVPLFPNHRDPFDRILIATAACENIPIISSDSNFQLYSDLLEIIVA